MILCRYLLAVALFITGIICLFRFIFMGWEWLFLGISIACLLMAHWALPKQQKQQRRQRRQQRAHDYSGFDVFEILIEFPIELMFQLIILPLRFLRIIVHFLDGL